MKIDGNFCEEIEISAVSEIFNLGIFVLEKIKDNAGYRLLYRIKDDNNILKRTMTINYQYLENSYIEHFDMLCISIIISNYHALHSIILKYCMLQSILSGLATEQKLPEG